MRGIALLLTSALLTGCAILPWSERDRSSAIATEEALSRASLDAPRYATAQGPVGLAPCAKKKFPARGCWRKGDEHILYPASAPEDLYASGKSDNPVTVSDER